MTNDAVPRDEPGAAGSTPALVDLVLHVHYELVPISTIGRAIGELPPASTVSVTCSPVHGLPPTLSHAERLIELGHRAVPHLAARKVDGPATVAAIAAWTRRHHVREVFVIAGDAPEPDGPYHGAVALIEELLAAGPRVERIGVAGYPDGHPKIPPDVLREQLHAKQELLRSAGVGGWISTQMCFDATAIRSWLDEIRADGIDLPVRLGIPGVIDRIRLMRLGAKLGVGASLRFVSKNRTAARRLLTPGGFDPTVLAAAIADDATELGVEGLHAFTFNAVADTRAWQCSLLAGH